MNHIYILLDPIDNKVRYIGKTVNPGRRFSQHLYECDKIKTHKNNWLYSLKSKNLKPEMYVIDIVGDDWEFWEQFYIDIYRSWGFKLTNTLDGGNSRKKYKVSDNTGKKISESLKGKKRSQEFKDKISKAVKGRKYTEEQKKIFSEGAKKRKISEETRKKMIESKRKSGWKHTEESKKIISEKMKIIRNEQINRRRLGE